MTAVERVAEVLAALRNGKTWPMSAIDLAQALADAGLLVTDEQRVILDQVYAQHALAAAIEAEATR